jgi:hypothetical protein
MARGGAGAAPPGRRDGTMDVETSEPTEYLIGVRLREVAKADDYRLGGDLVLHVGDLVVVESAGGEAVGEVRRPRRPLPASRRDRAYPRVLRPASEAEARQWRERREREKRAARRPAPAAPAPGAPVAEQVMAKAEAEASE